MQYDVRQFALFAEKEDKKLSSASICYMDIKRDKMVYWVKMVSHPYMAQHNCISSCKGRKFQPVVNANAHLLDL